MKGIEPPVSVPGAVLCDRCWAGTGPQGAHSLWEDDSRPGCPATSSRGPHQVVLALSLGLLCHSGLSLCFLFVRFLCVEI